MHSCCCWSYSASCISMHGSNNELNSNTREYRLELDTLTLVTVVTLNICINVNVHSPVNSIDNESNRDRIINWLIWAVHLENKKEKLLLLSTKSFWKCPHSVISKQKLTNNGSSSAKVCIQSSLNSSKTKQHNTTRMAKLNVIPHSHNGLCAGTTKAGVHLQNTFNRNFASLPRSRLHLLPICACARENPQGEAQRRLYRFAILRTNRTWILLT